MCIYIRRSICVVWVVLPKKRDSRMRSEIVDDNGVPGDIQKEVKHRETSCTNSLNSHGQNVGGALVGKVFAVFVRLMEQCRKRWVKQEERALWHFMDCCEVLCPTFLLSRCRTIFIICWKGFRGFGV